MRCVDGCFKCCISTEMVLSEDDIRRLETLGYKKEDFVVYIGGFYRLKNIDGHCIFLDISSGKCKVYKYRPIGCRIYPAIYNPRKGFTLDKICPAINTVSMIEFIGRVNALKWFLSKIGYKQL